MYAEEKLKQEILKEAIHLIPMYLVESSLVVPYN